jgi:hypothetical protein
VATAGDRRCAGLGADHRGGEHRRRGDQPERDGQVVAVGQPGGQRPHRLHRRAVEQAGVERGDLGEHLGAGLSERRGEIGRQVGEEAVEQQADQRFVAGAAGQLVKRATADDQPAGLAVDLREHGLGRDHAFQSVGHQILLKLLVSRQICRQALVVNLDQCNQYA